MNPIIIPLALSKIAGKLGSLALIRQLVKEKENSEYKPVKLRLKVGLVPHASLLVGLGKYIQLAGILSFPSPKMVSLPR